MNKKIRTLLLIAAVLVSLLGVNEYLRAQTGVGPHIVDVRATFRQVVFIGRNILDATVVTAKNYLLVVQAYSGQTTPAVEIRNSGGTAVGNISIAGKQTWPLYVAVSVPVTIADSGGVGAATSTLTSPVGTHYAYTCSDADGCELTLGETGVVTGQMIIITNRSANTLTVKDTAGALEASGDAALGQYDSVWAIYDSDRFVQVAPESDN